MTDPVRSRPGRIVSALTCNRKVRVLVAVMDGPAEELRVRHRLGPEAARLGAEALVAAALLSSQLKGEERHTVNLFGETPRFELTADVWATGQMRARFSPENIPATERFRGLIAVLKFLGSQELYRGIADILDESLEDALQRYFIRSVQVDARVRVAAELDEDGKIIFAAGMLVERFPDMEAEAFAELIDEPIRTDFRYLMAEFNFGFLGGELVEVLGQQELVYKCPCSKERAQAILKSLGAQDLVSILKEDGKAEVTCHFCNTVWTVTTPELEQLLVELGEEQGDLN